MSAANARQVARSFAVCVSNPISVDDTSVVNCRTFRFKYIASNDILRDCDIKVFTIVDISFQIFNERIENQTRRKSLVGTL